MISESHRLASIKHVTHQPYDVTAILRQNVADLERELQRQRDRADKAELRNRILENGQQRLRDQIERVTGEWERAEAELASAREDLQSFIDARNEWMARAEAADAELKAAREQPADQKPWAWDCGGDITTNKEYADWFTRSGHGEAKPLALYTSPIPAPAPYLLEGRRFKISINGEGGFYGFEGFPELDGQWVALVDATDNQHMQSAGGGK